MLNFDYNIQTVIHFGKGKVIELGPELRKNSSNILFVYGQGSIKKTGVYDQVTDILNEHNISFQELSGVKPNPHISSVRKGIRLCNDYELDFVLAVGGGSVTDCAKAIAAGYYWNEDVWDLFLGKEHEIKKTLPVGSVLTISATGSEMNGNAVITNEDSKDKLGIHHDLLRPQFSILDPTFTFSVPKKQTAAGVVDTYSHVLEQYFSKTTGAFVQNRLSEAILKTCIHYGPIALTHPTDYDARANLMWSSSIALNKLLSYGKQTDWATHGIEHAVSAVYDITHAVGLAILTPSWMKYVLDDDTRLLFEMYAKNVWGCKEKDSKVLAMKGIDKTKDFFLS
ncbi:MAG: iron-containing alcohol dehydrogenase, partial [Candidatus Thermoplasmatota archaeon]|nr:iron-containing alcohol dehydrogenase [Candidatus Thermoplasmatota archaeon]